MIRPVRVVRQLGNQLSTSVYTPRLLTPLTAVNEQLKTKKTKQKIINNPLKAGM